MLPKLSSTQRNILVHLFDQPGLSSYRLRTPITVVERLVGLGLLQKVVVNGGKQPRFDNRYSLSAAGLARAQAIIDRREQRAKNAKKRKAALPAS